MTVTSSQAAACLIASTRRLRLSGAIVRVAVCGQGPPLLMLNGIGASIEMWQPLAQRLPGRQLILVDVPGTGESPPLPRRLRIPGYARLLVELLDALCIEQTDVLGYSWGGALAQQLARGAPERVRSLVLAATIPGLGGQPPAPWVLALMATPARYYSRTYLRYASPLMFGSPPASADAAAADARLRRPPSLRGYAQQMYAITWWSSRLWLRQITVPTLIVAAAGDPLVPRRNARILAHAISGAELSMVEGGHLFLHEHPEQAAKVIQTFLAKQDRVGPQPGGTRSRT